MAFITTEAAKVLQPMPLLVWLIVACLVSATSSLNAFKRATDSNRTDLCATEHPSAKYDIYKLDLLYSNSICPQPEALCSLKCRREPECIALNWNAETRWCELYFHSPTQCGYVLNCVHFESTACGQSSCGSDVFSITADNEVRQLYFDGCELTNLPGRTDWGQTDSVPLSLTASVIAVEMHNDAYDVGGLLASSNTILTDGTWKVTTNYTSGWMDVNFDDSTWNNATTYGYNGVGPWYARSGISGNAQWISTENGLDTTVYFRYHLKRGNL